MNIDWEAFTPWSALAGGAIIGFAAAMFALVNGRIAGISGIVGGLLRPTLPDAAWRAAFLAGLVVAPIVYVLFAPLPPIVIDTGYAVLVVAGSPRRRRDALWGRLHERSRRLRIIAGFARARSLPRSCSWQQGLPRCSSPGTSSRADRGHVRDFSPSSQVSRSESGSSSPRWRIRRKCSDFSISRDAGIRRSPWSWAARSSSLSSGLRSPVGGRQRCSERLRFCRRHA